MSRFENLFPTVKMSRRGSPEIQIGSQRVTGLASIKRAGPGWPTVLTVSFIAGDIILDGDHHTPTEDTPIFDQLQKELQQ